jgi:nucleotide-binding universal stress UspA family protein
LHAEQDDDAMSGLEKILCATDFSDASKEALRHALSLAALSGGHVHLVHACEVPYTVRPDVMVWLEGGARPLEDLAREQSESEMAAAVASLSDDDRAKVSARVVMGDPSDVIPSLAKVEAFDLIVTGTHQRSAFEHFVLGSVAEKIVRRAPCPVYVVRGDPPPKGDPLPKGDPPPKGDHA